jgi:tRNA 2-selenouridine synthase
MTVSIEDFFALRTQIPTIDVRSEGEYAQGHIRQAVNVPLLNNEERAIVGTTYKQSGQLEAIKAGFNLVGPRLGEIIEETLRLVRYRNSDEVLVHCWRGGMRSANFCSFVNMVGVKTNTLEGGYKAYRNKAVESFSLPFRFTVLGGCTGSGKSEILLALAHAGEQVIDFEKLAKHKGSVFGGLMMPSQPTTEQFQNDLFEEILNMDLSKRIWIEDESIGIGQVFLPDPLWRTMGASPLVELEASREIRVHRLVEEYGSADKQEFLDAMQKITRRLGGQHFNAAREKLEEGDMYAVIDILLTYYDKAYLNGLNRKMQRIVGKIAWEGKDSSTVVEELLNTEHRL